MCMCVCWEGLQSGMAESFLYTISSPTPSISLQFLSLLEKKLGTSFPAMSLDLWLCDNETELKKTTLQDADIENRLMDTWWEGVGGGKENQKGRDICIPMADSC